MPSDEAPLGAKEGLTVAEQLLTVSQVAEWLGRHPKTIYKLTETNQLPFVRLGTKSIRFRPTDIERYIAGSTVPARGSS
jgi:excisionase family DNA binding protein